MNIRRCPAPCGMIPSVIRRTKKGIDSIQVQCACGKHGASILFTKHEQREWAEQAAIDGWNLNVE